MTSAPPAYVAALLRPEAYPHPVDSVELVETHVSYLFLTGPYVYKVKKAVKYAFLNFTTLARRRRYCQRELELNRRFSPDAYLGVRRFTLDQGAYRIEGSGALVDYAVQMRQMPRERALSTLLEQDRVPPAQLERLARRIAALHAAAPHGPAVVRWGGAAQVRRKLLGNLAEAEAAPRGLSAELRAELQAYAEAFLAVHGALLDERAATGRVRDCHGDLHSAQIYLEQKRITFLDCIEFDDALRCIDVAEDLAFLTMDLECRGHPELSRLLLQRYVEASGDPDVARLQPLFKQYRACVRGKVLALLAGALAEQPERAAGYATQSEAYFRLAESYLPRPHSPELFLTSGLMGTGKSTLAQELARRWGLAYVSSDATRKRLAGVPLTERHAEAYDAGLYAPARSRATYARLFTEARAALQRGQAVVLDASFQAAAERRRALALAQELGAPCWVIECRASEAEIRLRLAARERSGSISDGRWALFHQQAARREPIAEFPPGRHLILDTNGTLDQTIQRLLTTLYATRLQAPPPAA